MRGKRRLAYQIAKHREGIYVQLSHQGDGQHISKLEKAMRLSEDVIRYLTVKQEGPLPTPRPSTKSSTKADEKENLETKVESWLRGCSKIYYSRFNKFKSFNNFSNIT